MRVTTPPPGPGAGEAPRRPGLRRLPDLLGRLLDAPARQRGLAGAALLEDWALVVGHALADKCQPVRLDRRSGDAVLHLRVSGGAALEIQHMTPQIIERINDHFGFAAVARLRLMQAPAARHRRPWRAPERPLSAEAAAAIEGAVRPVADPALKNALAGLGRALHRRPPVDR